MKLYRALIILILLSLPLSGFLLSSSLAMAAVQQQTETATAEPTAEPTEEPEPTESPTDVPTAPGVYLRPLIIVHSYSADASDITPGKEFKLDVRLANEGKDTAYNIVAIFSSGDFTPRETGGVIAVDDLVPGDRHRISQPLTTSYDLWGKTVATLDMTVNYTDGQGLSYQEQFAITFPIAWTRIVGAATATPTPTVTPTPQLRPQLVITSYLTDVSPLQPGGQFSLDLNVQNLGNADAKQVTMILGGGSTSGGDSISGTSVPPGGVSGGSSDLTNFAPLGSSNVQSLGDLRAGGTMMARQSLIVNVSTNPGAYSLKVSFVYTDDKNNSFTDDQVITLLVYSLPNLEISFYRDPGLLMAGQPNMLPLQVVNLSRKSALLGNMKVTAEGVDFTNNVILIGNLEAGQYFPLDANAIPYQAGPLELTVSVNYTDDFNQPQQVTQTLIVEVMEAPPMEPGMEPGGEGIPIDPGFEQPPDQGTFWQKVVRFFRGLFGLDSGVAGPEFPGEMPPGMEGGPVEGMPLEGP
jgi:hypothetical protein